MPHSSPCAHDDAINVIAADCGVVYSAFADGRVKAWEKGEDGGSTHSLLAVLIARDGVSWNAVVTADSRANGASMCTWQARMGTSSAGTGAWWNLAFDVKAHAMAVLYDRPVAPAAGPEGSQLGLPSTAPLERETGPWPLFYFFIFLLG